MRKLIFLPFVFILNIFILGCDKDGELFRESILNRSWIESHEEKTSDEIEIYRPGNHSDFPSSRFRQVFFFGDNNELEYSVLASNDAHYRARGSWEYNEKTKILEVCNSNSEKIYEFVIIELTRNVLKLRANN